MNEFETIPVDALQHVEGGNLGSNAQKLYKWWTKTRTPTSKIPPQKVFNEAMRVGRNIGVGAGAAIYGAKQLLGSGDHDAPARSSDESAGGSEE